MDLKRTSSWISMGPITNDKSLEEERWAKQSWGESHMAGVQWPPEAETSKEESPLDPLEGAWPCRH